MSQMKPYCFKCGAELDPEAIYCPECGRLQRSMVVRSVDPGAPSPPPPAHPNPSGQQPGQPDPRADPQYADHGWYAAHQTDAPAEPARGHEAWAAEAGQPPYDERSAQAPDQRHGQQAYQEQGYQDPTYQHQGYDDQTHQAPAYQEESWADPGHEAYRPETAPDQGQPEAPYGHQEPPYGHQEPPYGHQEPPYGQPEAQAPYAHHAPAYGVPGEAPEEQEPYSPEPTHPPPSYSPPTYPPPRASAAEPYARSRPGYSSAAPYAAGGQAPTAPAGGGTYGARTPGRAHAAPGNPYAPTYQRGAAPESGGSNTVRLVALAAAGLLGLFLIGFGIGHLLGVGGSGSPSAAPQQNEQPTAASSTQPSATPRTSPTPADGGITGNARFQRVSGPSIPGKCTVAQGCPVQLTLKNNGDRGSGTVTVTLNDGNDSMIATFSGPIPTTDAGATVQVSGFATGDQLGDYLRKGGTVYIKSTDIRNGG